MSGKRVFMGALLILVLMMAGCQGGGDDEDDFTVKLALTPDPPKVGAATLVVTLHDADGEPISGAKMELEGTMTHAGMKPVFGQAAEDEPGRYEAELEFSMGGDWVIIVRADLPDGNLLEKEFDVRGVKKP